MKSETLTKSISLKDFLSNVKTKAELTENLAVKCLSHFVTHPDRLKKFIVTVGTETRGNTDIQNILCSHSHEEADTLLIPHALTMDKNAELVVDSPGADVFLLLTGMFPKLPSGIKFLTVIRKTRRSIAVKPVYDVLGEKRSSAIIGFHAFTESDMSGRFAGSSKEWFFKVLMECDKKITKVLESLGCGDRSPEIVSQLE